MSLSSQNDSNNNTHFIGSICSKINSFQNPKNSAVIGRFRYPIPLCTYISYCHFSNTTHFTNPT